MEKNRLFIIISAAVAILSSFLPWASLNAGNFGSYSWNGLRGDGWFVIIFAVVAIVLACLNDVKSSLPKGFAIGVIVSGALSTVVTLIDVFGVNKYAANFNGYGVSMGFGLILALIASIAIVVTGLLAMSGGKITKGTFEELAESGKGFAQSVGRVTTSTVKTAVDEIKKETHEHTEGQADQPVEAPKDPNQSEQ
ncbi:lantibiotic ABC transporter permease [Streptococcus parasanguinis]|uniref:lantibiotic ABC transporter permease n=1 Tax=Streptococcus parasanguinis TaxID=1318 RepID=UPI0012BB876C|nr:lantibiotic ABC transporter permease [Streptococcus parasanguinis]MTR98709.1 lantibiotic ABC transporter permease [Streptococcus parasanguinis]MTS10393.1 lantibiotic ABC transporter permease [Streptococcus parasanguinis]